MDHLEHFIQFIFLTLEHAYYYYQTFTWSFHIYDFPMNHSFSAYAKISEKLIFRKFLRTY